MVPHELEGDNVRGLEDDLLALEPLRKELLRQAREEIIGIWCAANVYLHRCHIVTVVKVNGARIGIAVVVPEEKQPDTEVPSAPTGDAVPCVLTFAIQCLVEVDYAG